MDLKLRGTRALVTGSTAGIGWAIARELAAEGAQVVLNGRDPWRLTQAVERLYAEVRSAEVVAVQADVGTAEGCEHLAEAAGDVDILVNNCGIYEAIPFEAIADAHWQRLFDVNVMSGVRLTRALLPAMKARNWGRVVFVSSESGVCPPADMAHYGMTKSAQLSVSRAVAEGCAGTGVTVNAVLPGPTRTAGAIAFVERLARETGCALADAEQAFFREQRPTSLLHRFVEPAEIAATVAFMCSPLAAAMNGTALRVDGGVVRSLT
jgi:NAD(P)-dependent dehydrogenase (short-subunit alcohol dehydrogenase family)